MAIESKTMFTVQCDCCGLNYMDDNSGFAFWHDSDDAWQYAADEGWIKNAVESEHDDYQHFCSDCFTINDDDIVTTKNGVTFEN